MNRRLHVLVVCLVAAMSLPLGVSGWGQFERDDLQIYLPVTTSLYSPVPPPLPTPDQVVDMGELFDLDEEIGSAVLPAKLTHSYTLEVFEGESWTVGAIASADLVLSVWLDNVLLIDRHNTAPAGAAESVRSTPSMGAGVYEIWVMSQNQAEAEYAITGYFQDDFPILFNGFLTPGQASGKITSELHEVQYWFYDGMAGQTIRLHLETGSTNDGLIDIYGPGAEYLDTVDDGFEGEAETYTFELPATGLYAFSISDIDYASMVYTLSLSLE